MKVQSVSVGNSVQTALDSIFSYLPKILGFLVIVVIGYIIARVVKTIANKLLERSKVDEKLQGNKAGSYVERLSPDGKPSHLLGAVIFWVIFLYALVAAIGALKIPALTGFMNKVLSYLPNVLAAVLIFVIAAVIAGAVVAAVQATMGDTPTGKLVQTVIPGLIMAIAVFMILTQLRIAPTIVVITYAALLGMLALTGALAFGLGGRDVAAQMWSAAYEKGQAQAGQARADLQVGKDRAQQRARQASEAADRRFGDGQPDGHIQATTGDGTGSYRY